MRAALAFLTVLGGSRVPGARTLRWFPLAGLVIGALIAVVHAGAHALWPPLVAGAIVLAADLALTGALHVDGLADTADGVLPHLPAERRLDVMADPGVGAFAAAVLLATVALRWAVLADAGLSPATIVAIWAAGRTVAAAVPALVPYARPGGLASPFLAGASRWTLAWLVPLAAVAGLERDWPAAEAISGAVAIAGGAAAGLGIVALARRRLGGFTGDVLGAVIVVTETVALVAASATW